MKKKHNIKITDTFAGIEISFSDDYHSKQNPLTMGFDSVSEAREFAYELLEETMNFVINKGQQ